MPHSLPPNTFHTREHSHAYLFNSGTSPFPGTDGKIIGRGWDKFNYVIWEPHIGGVLVHSMMACVCVWVFA